MKLIRKIPVLKNKTFWTVLMGVNITSCMMSAFVGSVEGTLISGIAMLSCFFVLTTIEKYED